MPLWLEILIGLTLLSTIIMVIAENRRPIRTLAWIMVLTFLPVAGLVLYFLFGINKRNVRLVKDEDLKKFKSNTINLFALQMRSDPDGCECGDLVRLLWGTNMAFPLCGNKAEVYTTFDAMLEDMLKDLSQARHHIHFEFFKFEDDPIGRRVAELLVRKAREGVEVRVQYDDAANLSRKRFFRYMEKNGVAVKPFIRVIIPFLSSNTNYRNHRKIVVIDGKVGYIGGMNIAERYSMGIRGGVWRDTHLRVSGPSVSELQTAFLVDWQFSSGEFLSSLSYYPSIEPEGDVTMQIATSGPMDEWKVIMQGIVQMISQSRSYVYIESPYLIPTEPVLFALKNAALSGVDVRIIIPYRGDRGIIVPLASRSYVKELLTAGVRIFFYSNGYMHSKTAVSDDRVLTIGSTNMDVRSYEQDFEANAFIYNRALAFKMKNIFLEDEALSREVDPSEWSKRPVLKRFSESLARLFSPLL